MHWDCGRFSFAREEWTLTNRDDLFHLPPVRLSADWQPVRPQGGEHRLGAEVSFSYTQSEGEQRCCIVPKVLAQTLSIRLLAYARTPTLLYTATCKSGVRAFGLTLGNTGFENRVMCSYDR